MKDFCWTLAKTLEITESATVETIWPIPFVLQRGN